MRSTSARARLGSPGSVVLPTKSTKSRPSQETLPRESIVTRYTGHFPKHGARSSVTLKVAAAGAASHRSGSAHEGSGADASGVPASRPEGPGASSGDGTTVSLPASRPIGACSSGRDTGRRCEHAALTVMTTATLPAHAAERSTRLTSAPLRA